MAATNTRRGVAFRNLSVESSSQIMAKFVKACEEGDNMEVKNLLKFVANPTFPRDKLEAGFRPPIYWACKGGHLNIVKLLIEKYPGCNPYCITDQGHNLLYVACARGHINVTCYLNEVYSLSPSECNSHGTTPIFAATYNGHYAMLKLLINQLKCDPRALNKSGDSLLHIACGRSHLNIAKYLVERHNLNPRMENSFKKTPLHSACSSGNLSIVKYLIEELKCEIEVFDGAGCTPLHDACRNGFNDIVQYFVQKKCDLNLYDSSGCTPLHLSCRFGRKDIIKTLLTMGNVNPNKPTLADLFPIEIARDKDAIKELIRGGANTSGMSLDIFHEYKQQQPLHSIVHIFMIGHSESGKSTLVKALQRPTKKIYIGRPNMYVMPHTAGVIPTEFDSPDFGKVLLYDFAGHYEFHPSHAALLEHSKFASPPLFLLVVKLLDVFEESKRKINYWIQFVENHSIPGATSPHIIVIGSHYDLLPRPNTIVSNIEEYVRSRLKSSDLVLNGFFPIDCRAAGRHNNLRLCLKQSCNNLRTNKAVNSACHVLSVLLIQNFEKSFACTIQDVIEVAKESDYPLPIKAEHLCKLAEALSARTKILFLRNYIDPKASWIVLDIDALLRKINGRIFAPKGFAENVFNPSHTGVIPWSQLTKHFPDFDPSLIVAFLGRLEFCQVISDAEVLDLIEGKKGGAPCSSDSDDEVFCDSPASKPAHQPKSSLLYPDFGNSTSQEDVKDGPDKRLTKSLHPKCDIHGTSEKHYIRSHSDGYTSLSTCTCDTHCQTSASIVLGDKPIGIFDPADGASRYGRSYSSPYNPKQVPSYLGYELGPSLRSSRSHTNPTMMTSNAVFGHPGSFLSLELKEKYLFFPGLISPEQPKEDMWSNDDSFAFYSGWCLQCIDDQQFFSLRFLQTLLLRLSFSFAVSKSMNGLCEQLECTLWKNGLRWLNLDGIETIVEVVEDRKAVLLLIRMKQNSVMKGLHLRAAIIKKILDTKKEYCLRINTSESLIDPFHLKARHGYPVINQHIDELTRYDISLIATAFCRKKHFVFDIKHQKLIEIEEIIKFDPYMCVGERFLQMMYNRDQQDDSLTQEFLLDFSFCYSERANEFEDILLDGERLSHAPRPVERLSLPNQDCFRVLCRYWERGTWTMADFRNKLDMYSIFCGRNIIEYST